MTDESDFQFSDDDVDENKHAEIVQNVLNVNKSHHLKKSSRTEPTLQISEFNLVKSVTGQKGSVRIDGLAEALKTRRKHVKIGEKVQLVNKHSHTLPKPLEKPQAERIKRSVGYEKNRYLFDRWEAFVTSNRAQAHQSFPLDSVKKVKVDPKQKEDFTSSWTFKSGLQKELEKLDTQVEKYHIEAEEEKDEFSLTLKELKEKRKEAAKLRAHQRFKEEKARKRNKIKSKKYHRILRKERIKQKLKDFEELQKSNPEEALKKLEEIEKARALERFSLRHKGTGQWAKSKQVRAKYDKESRQILAQQLQISRDLTQKQAYLGSDSEDEVIISEESSNPWIGNPKSEREVTSFVSDYKKFWLAQNNQVELSQSKVDTETFTESNANNTSDEEENIYDGRQLIKGKQEDDFENKHSEQEISNGRRNLPEVGKPLQTHSKKKSKLRVSNPSGNWDIEEMFDNAEKKLERILKKKLLNHETGKIAQKSAQKLKSKKKINQKKISKKSDLNMPSQSKKQVVDEEMIENPLRQEADTRNSDINALKSILGNGSSSCKKPVLKQLGPSTDIDPGRFLQPKITSLDSMLPNLMVEDENTEGSIQKNMIIEAFEDNDIVDEFTKEKKDELDKDKPHDIDLNLPGWGSWSGAGIKPKKQRKRRRFIVKMPELMPRKDVNRGSLIINEKAGVKMKPHLVSEVPFPFKTVKDYEASIRAPIGNTFVPELAHTRFIRPAVETKMGAIIEPATLSVLMGKTRQQ